jgi:hypothetical protein
MSHLARILMLAGGVLAMGAAAFSLERAVMRATTFPAKLAVGGGLLVIVGAGLAAAALALFAP